MPGFTRALAVALAAAAAVVPASARADDAKTFLADTRRFDSLRSFRLDLDAVSPTAGPTSRVLTYVAPDKLRIDVGFPKGVEVVVIGKRVWVRGVDGKWHTEAVRPGSDPLAELHAFSNPARGLQDQVVTFVGTRQLDGVATHEYRLAAKPKPGLIGRTTQIWIGVSDGYPHRVELRAGPYQSTARYSAFNRPLSVSGP